MPENNAVTREELKELMAEMRQEFRKDAAETNQNVVALRHKVDGLEHKVDGLEHKVDGLDRKVDANEQKNEAFRTETLARFDVMDKKHDAVVRAIFAHEKKTDAQYEELRGMLSKLMTSLDPQMRELEIIRHEQLSLGAIQDRQGAIQDRQGRDIEFIKKHLELDTNNGKPRENTAAKSP